MNEELQLSVLPRSALTDSQRRTPPLDLHASLSVEWREGEVW